MVLVELLSVMRLRRMRGIFIWRVVRLVDDDRGSDFRNKVSVHVKFIGNWRVGLMRGILWLEYSIAV